MRQLLGRIPWIQRFYFESRYLLQIAREVFLTDPVAMNDRSHLEREWNFGAGPDKDRWQRVLALVTGLRGARWGEVLEIGCAEGLITEVIAQHADRLLAGDISPVARARAAERLRGAGHVNITSLDLQRDVLGIHDVVFAMDVLEFIHGRGRLRRTIAKLASAVRPGGLLVVSMCRYPPDIRDAWWQRWVPEGADSVVPLISSWPGLDRVHYEPHPSDGRPIPDYLDHVIAIFRRG